MLKIRRPLWRLIFNMGIAIPGKTVFLIETAPWITSLAWVKLYNCKKSSRRKWYDWPPNCIIRVSYKYEHSCCCVLFCYSKTQHSNNCVQNSEYIQCKPYASASLYGIPLPSNPPAIWSISRQAILKTKQPLTLASWLLSWEYHLIHQMTTYLLEICILQSILINNT